LSNAIPDISRLGSGGRDGADGAGAALRGGEAIAPPVGLVLVII
jgi:hypothetical protein